MIETHDRVISHITTQNVDAHYHDQRAINLRPHNIAKKTEAYSTVWKIPTIDFLLLIFRRHLIAKIGEHCFIVSKATVSIKVVRMSI